MLVSRTCFGTDKEYCEMLAAAGYTAVDVNDTSHNPEIFLQSEEVQYAFVKNVVENIKMQGLKSVNVMHRTLFRYGAVLPKR